MPAARVNSRRATRVSGRARYPVIRASTYCRKDACSGRRCAVREEVEPQPRGSDGVRFLHEELAALFEAPAGGRERECQQQAHQPEHRAIHDVEAGGLDVVLVPDLPQSHPTPQLQREQEDHEKKLKKRKALDSRKNIGSSREAGMRVTTRAVPAAEGARRA
jgi:hypothetical protein